MPLVASTGHCPHHNSTTRASYHAAFWKWSPSPFSRLLEFRKREEVHSWSLYAIACKSIFTNMKFETPKLPVESNTNSVINFTVVFDIFVIHSFS
jgi:hypothetical protein